ncbi:hypothetical protein [Actinomadura sp. 21ATH]|uniref:hypothetical protein n=1 Tax=Actinomadura sp. 21ATH TaxID=1735444 RepID=UPI0035C0D127
MQSFTRERPEIHFLTSGPVTEAERAAAERALLAALDGVAGTVTSARLTLSVVTGSALPRPALAQAVVDIDGRRLRAQAAAPTLPEAVALLHRRMAVRVPRAVQAG